MRKITELLLMITLLSCHRRQAGTQVTVETITESVYASGIVKSNDQYQVYAPINGIIAKYFVKEGDSVRNGDPLLQVKAETAHLNINNARLAADNASISSNTEKINEIQASIDFLVTKIQNDSLLWDRQRNLWSENIGTKNELEQKELAYQNDVSTLRSTRSRLNDLRRQLDFNAQQSRTNLQITKTIADDYLVKSQLDGKVYQILKKEGELVNAQNALAIIGANNNFLIELQVDEYDIARIKPGQQTLLTMDSYKQKAFEARITRIIPFMNDRTRSFTVEAVFTSPPPALYPNLTVEANIVIQTKEKALTIPRDFLVNDSLVWMSDGSKRKVDVGLKDYDKAEIINGLVAGEKIIKPNP